LSLSLLYLDLSEIDLGAVTMATDEQKWKALAKLGIERPEDESTSPLAAWRDAMADENNIPRAELDPAQGGSLDLGFTSTAVRNWVWFLA
jgi:hypothetical protein